MTAQQIVRVITLYEEKLATHQVFGGEADLDQKSPAKYEAIDHCRSMFPKIKEFAEKDQAKAFRWLGFVQGCLWSNGIYSINELRAHNQP